MKYVRTIASALALSFAITSPASAAVFIVKAFDHSINNGGGTPLNTGLVFSLGQNFSVSSSTNDLWSAGPLPRFSDGNGLVGPRTATALDDSGQAPGTVIGGNFGLPNIDGFIAPFGSLVGRINGQYQLLGANFSGPAWNGGALELFYWDTDKGNNFGEIAFNITGIGGVPEPATWGMMILGFGAIGSAMRYRRRRTSVSFG